MALCFGQNLFLKMVIGSIGVILITTFSWLVLTDRGQLLIVKPSGKGYEPVAEYKVSDTQTWAYPVFLGDRILVRDQTTLRSFGLKEDGTR